LPMELLLLLIQPSPYTESKDRQWLLAQHTNQ
jgi:hypothetical protein